MSLKDVLIKTGMVEDDTVPVHARIPDPPVPSTPPPALSAYAAERAVATGAVADPEMVDRLKNHVLSASPLASQFMVNIDLMSAAFPAQEGNAMRAALAATRVTKAALLQELTTSVAASLQHATAQAESDHRAAFAEATGAAVTDLKDINDAIQSIEAQLADKKNRRDALTMRIHDAEASVARQDAVARATLQAVTSQLDILRQQVERL